MKPGMIFAAVAAVCILMFAFLPRLARPTSASAASEAARASLAVQPALTATPGQLPEPKKHVKVEQPAPVLVKPTPTLPAVAAADIPAPSNPPPAQKGQAAIPISAGETVPKDFINSVTNGQADTVTGLFVPGQYALPVRQQPGGNPDFISDEAGTLTQYQRPSQYGVTALLAHNTLSGELFFHLKSNQELDLVYGDGRIARFTIAGVQSYQALSPNSPSSDFVDLNGPNLPQLTHTQLFERVYTNAGRLVLQTCINANGNPTWGRLFVIATPIA